MTTVFQVAALLVMAAFYAAYFTKMAAQARRGIQTDQMGKGKQAGTRRTVEILLKVATVSIVPVQLASIFLGHSVFRYGFKEIGLCLGILGVAAFAVAAFTMADSWRAGIAENEKTDLVTKGVFHISRNPAFLGFDLQYLGILLMFFNWPLALWTLWAMVMLHLQILQEERYLTGVFGEEYTRYKKRVCRYFGLKTWKFFVPAALLVVACIVGWAMYGTSQQQKVPSLSFQEALAYTTQGNSDAVITVGVLKDGQASYTVYGADGRELSHDLHTYEIGSLTKTFTATCIARAQEEGLLSIDDPLDRYLDLPALTGGDSYPTIAQLLTHTAGYESLYFEPVMVWNVLTDGNIYHYVTKEDVLQQAGRLAATDSPCEWSYSNFGYALLGLVVEKVYGEEYYAVVNDYLRELGLSSTSFSADAADLGNCWSWYSTDGYASAGALKSNVTDMLAYAQAQLENESLVATHAPLAQINNAPAMYDLMGIHTDQIGMAWIVDNQNGFVWHNGATDDYNCYLGFSPAEQTAVVVLSNLPANYRLPATVLGIKLLQETCAA